MTRHWTPFAPAVLLGVSLAVVTIDSAKPAPQPAGQLTNVTVAPALFDGLRYRSLNFSRGGRSTAVAGVVSQPLTYYFGSTGGGVWKTTDAGITWSNVSDGFLEAASIGALAVAESDSNVVYVGTGSACPRPNISPGVGVYRSTDAGRTWTHAGLRNAGQIGRIRVHPTDPNLVYVAALGNLFGPNEERGLFRSKDGGKTWEKILFISDKTGVVDLSMDPTNPRILYAGLWSVERKLWKIDSASMDGGIYKTTDGGDTWARVTRGLPTGMMIGRTAVAISPASPDRVWALVEAANDLSGLYRSDDGGKSWRRINNQRPLLLRAWYYTHLYAHPTNPDTVYVLNTGFYKSTDGGRTFQTHAVPHGDNHDLWINSKNPDLMINANDGGANVSFNGGASWSGQMNQPTAEIYRVTVDPRFPYRVYGAQQDNTTISVSSYDEGGGRGESTFYAVGGGESGHIAVDPRNPNIVYAGSYGGAITRMDTSTGLIEDIRTSPEDTPGRRAADLINRFQWNAPIRMSPHDPDVLYHTSQYVHRTKNGGQDWETISPDLTRNDKSKEDYTAARAIIHGNGWGEVYGTIFAFEESSRTPGLLWAGSDDGLVHISRDNGAAWTNITPREMPEFGRVNMIDLSAHDPGRAHIAVLKYDQNDFQPYIFQTNDYGKTWRRLTGGRNGIPADRWVRVVREDPGRRGLLYAGTEFGMYISFDDGAHWQSFQLNLPVTPITDMLVHQKNLVVATQGRAFWILDDLSVLHQINDQVASTRAYLFKPQDAYRTGRGPTSIYYYLQGVPRQPVTIEISDAKGNLVARFTGMGGSDEGEPAARGAARRGARSSVGMRVGARAGLNRLAWDMRYAPLFELPGGSGPGGPESAPPRVVPAVYQVKVSTESWNQTQALEVKADPRLTTSPAAYEEQLALARAVGASLKEVYDNVATLRDVRAQATELGQRVQRAGQGEEVAAAARALAVKLTALEGRLTRLENQGPDDEATSGRLDAQFLVVYQRVVESDRRPSADVRQRFEDLKPELAALLAQLKEVFESDLAAFNEFVRTRNVPPVIPGRRPH